MIADVDGIELRVALVLVCGLPGCGKSSFCKALVARLEEEPDLLGRKAEVHHICYDNIETELRSVNSEFDPSSWQAARARAAEVVRERLYTKCARNMILLLDDNMYYRSMRKHWYHFAQQHHCAYRQVFLAAPKEVCLERNSGRAAASRVPDFSIHHMADVFEWPRESGESWEARDSISSIIETSSLSTADQLHQFIDRWAQPDGLNLWAPLLVEEQLEQEGPEVQSDAHACDVALRRVVSQALAHAPKELGQAKSVLAKQWGVRKGAFVKELTAEIKRGGEKIEGERVGDFINDMEATFLCSCVADVRQLLAERAASDSISV